jgi:hypothetical protein
MFQGEAGSEFIDYIFCKRTLAWRELDVCSVGGCHGIAQVIENHLDIKKESKILRFISWMVVFGFCNIAWVFFRAESIGDAWFVLTTVVKDITQPSLFLYSTIGLEKRELCCIMLTIAVLFGVDYAAVKTDVVAWISSKSPVFRWGSYLCLIWMILFFMKTTGTSEFVYFQF